MRPTATWLTLACSPVAVGYRRHSRHAAVRSAIDDRHEPRTGNRLRNRRRRGRRTRAGSAPFATRRSPVHATGLILLGVVHGDSKNWDAAILGLIVLTVIQLICGLVCASKWTIEDELKDRAPKADLTR